MTETSALSDFRNGNGDARPHRSVGNTYPTATRGSSEAVAVPPTSASRRYLVTLEDRLGAPAAYWEAAAHFHERMLAAVENLTTVQHPATGRRIAQFVRAPGQIVLLGKIMQVWGINEAEAAVLLGLEDSNAVGQLLRGVTSLRNQDPKDRLRSIIEIHSDLQALLRDDATEKQWMREPKALLDGLSPLEVMLRPQMTNLLRVHQFVEHISGR